MNRMALACTLAVVVLTMAALAQDPGTAAAPAEEVPARFAAPAAAPAAAAAAAGEAPTAVPTAPVRPRLAAAALRRRIETEVIAPLTKVSVDASMFSRVRLPRRSYELRMPEEEVPAPDEGASPRIAFEILERARHGGDPQARVQGRIDAFTGRIELALPRAQGVAPEDWRPAEEVLGVLGVRRGVTAESAATK